MRKEMIKQGRIGARGYVNIKRIKSYSLMNLPQMRGRKIGDGDGL
jgi:hypothetical protein